MPKPPFVTNLIKAQLYKKPNPLLVQRIVTSTQERNNKIVLHVQDFLTQELLELSKPIDLEDFYSMNNSHFSLYVKS